MVESNAAFTFGSNVLLNKATYATGSNVRSTRSEYLVASHFLHLTIG
jgi:hypothetical protein